MPLGAAQSSIHIYSPKRVTPLSGVGIKILLPCDVIEISAYNLTDRGWLQSLNIQELWDTIKMMSDAYCKLQTLLLQYSRILFCGYLRKSIFTNANILNTTN